MSVRRRHGGSVFSGIVLILIGVLFLLRQFVPGWDMERVLRYWPLLLILWGLAKLFDNYSANRTGQERPAVLTGGEALLFFILFVVIAATVGYDWVRHRSPDFELSSGMFDKSASASQEFPAVTVQPGSRISITTARGSITVHAGNTDQMHVVANKSSNALSQGEAQRQLEQIQVLSSTTAQGYDIHSRFGSSDSDSRVDLDVEVPKQVSVVAHTDRGDIHISDVAGTTQGSSQKGDVEIHGAGGDVSVETQNGDVHIDGAQGNVHLTGRGGEVELSDVEGGVSIEGEFFGPVRVRNVAKTTHFVSSNTDLTIAQLTGQFEGDSDKIEISDAPGNITLTTREKDVSFENVGGRIHVQNRHADVSVVFNHPPSEEVDISNDSGDVSLTMPGKSSFTIAAMSRSGELDSEFDASSLKASAEGDNNSLNGTLGTHGPQIRITTSYGTVNLRKAT